MQTKSKDCQTFQLMPNLNFKGNVIVILASLIDFQNCQKEYKILKTLFKKELVSFHTKRCQYWQISSILLIKSSKEI